MTPSLAAWPALPGGIIAATGGADHDGANVLSEYGSSAIFEKEGVPQGSLTRVTPGFGGTAAALRAETTAINSFARVQMVKAQTGWKFGQRIITGGALWLPVGFHAAKQGQIDVFRWDNFDQDGVTTERGGFVFQKSDRKIRLVRMKEPAEQKTLNLDAKENVIGPELGEGRWHWILADQILGNEEANSLNRIWINNQLIAETRKINCLRNDLEISRYRVGIVATNGSQTNPIAVIVDRIRCGVALFSANPVIG